MKNSGLILTIVIAILLAHGIIIYSCIHFSGDGKSVVKTDSGKTDSTAKQQQPAVSDFQEPRCIEKSAPAAGKGTTGISDASGLPGVPEIPVLATRSDLPFDYRYAVNGKINALPASANAASGILVDLSTRKVLWQKQARKGFPIASMTKVMTLLIVYEDVLAHRSGMTLDTPVRVSHKAMKIGGSQVYLDVKETFPLRDLMIATSIQSANDAAYLLAEYAGGGDVSAFIARMNRRAAQIGMPDTEFFNPHGLPGTRAALDNRASPEGMAKLAEVSLHHPQLVKWASTRIAPFRREGTAQFIRMVNHNHLLPGASEASTGVNGLKTGFTSRAKYCLTVTCVRNGRVMAGVVTGFQSRKERDRFVRSLLDWGYARAADPASALKKDATKQPQKKTVSKKKIRRTTRK